MLKQGQHATQDEIAASAFHAVALDDKYNGAPVQVRVVMGKEPKHFMSIFKGNLIIYEVNARASVEKRSTRCAYLLHHSFSLTCK